MALVIGGTLAGQGFYLLTLENLKQFGLLKAMGAANRQIVGMVLTQALALGLPGYSIGLGLAVVVERSLTSSQDAKGVPATAYMAWPIPLGVAVVLALILGATAIASVWRVLRLEPDVMLR